MASSYSSSFYFHFWFCVLLLLWNADDSFAWHSCSEEEGGGSCPDGATCCPTSMGSSCIPASVHDPPTAHGTCCSDGITGCGYGFECAVTTASTSTSTSTFVSQEEDDNYDNNDSDNPQKYCAPTTQDQPHRTTTSNITRYELCHVPMEMQVFHGFPIAGKQVAYYSNMNDFTVAENSHLQVENVVIMIHGSARNADDYFCAALSLLDDKVHTMQSTLVITPLFAGPNDTPTIVDDNKNDGEDIDIDIDDDDEDILFWADRPDHEHALSHSWRYGANALNAPVSSYAVVDAMVDYLSSAKVQFPNLRRIAVAGHSAGGQLTHRWALLSNSHAWDKSDINIVSVAANPRSYCYLDERRMLQDGTFDIPDPVETSICSGYNEWQWGLSDGGRVECPYKDEALKETPLDDLVKRYSHRNVAYLSGSLDNVNMTDKCETSFFQGKNRQERAKHYVQGLEEMFKRKVHQLHIIDGSPHDHSLMFQNKKAKEVIFDSGNHHVTMS